MKHILGLILALAMVLAVGSAALATPAVAGEQGQVVLFGDYNDWWPGFELGVGYAFTDSFTLGVLWEVSSDVFGGFATLSFDPFVASVAVGFDSFGYYGGAKAFYNFDLAPLTLGLGLIVDFWSSHPPEAGVEVAASFAISEQFKLFGSFAYRFDGFTSYDVGLSVAL